MTNYFRRLIFRSPLLLIIFWVATILSSVRAFGDGLYSQTFKATGTGTTIVQLSTGITAHQISWNPLGTVTTCQVSLDTSADGSAWSVGGAIAAQTCTAAGSSTLTLVSANYVRFNLSTFSGSGTVSVTWSGFQSNPLAPTGPIYFPASTTSSPSLRIPQGPTPTSNRVLGDVVNSSTQSLEMWDGTQFDIFALGMNLQATPLLGSDPCAVVNALGLLIQNATVPSGTIDASGFTGVWPCNSAMFVGIDKPIHLILPEATWVTSIPQPTPHIQFWFDGSGSASSGGSIRKGFTLAACGSEVPAGVTWNGGDSTCTTEHGSHDVPLFPNTTAYQLVFSWAQGPFPAGTYNALIVDAAMQDHSGPVFGYASAQNCFDHVYSNFSLSLGGLSNVFGWYGECSQENSRIDNVTANNMGAANSAYIFMNRLNDGSGAGTNVGMTHFKIIDAQLGTAGNLASNATWGIVYNGQPVLVTCTDSNGAPGSGFAGYAILASNAISSVKVVKQGSGYHNATTSCSASSAVGGPATLTPSFTADPGGITSIALGGTNSGFTGQNYGAGPILDGQITIGGGGSTNSGMSGGIWIGATSGFQLNGFTHCEWLVTCLQLGTDSQQVIGGHVNYIDFANRPATMTGTPNVDIINFGAATDTALTVSNVDAIGSSANIRLVNDNRPASVDNGSAAAVVIASNNAMTINNGINDYKGNWGVPFPPAGTTNNTHGLPVTEGWGAAWANIAPSATAGQPLESQGSSTDPAYAAPHYVMLLGTCASNPIPNGNGITYYLFPTSTTTGSNCTSVTTSANAIPIPVTCKVRAIYAKVGTASTSNLDIRIENPVAGTTSTFAYTAGSTAIQSSTGLSQQFTAGTDTYAISVHTNQATETAGNIRVAAYCY